jgi:hypothetical protein
VWPIRNSNILVVLKHRMLPIRFVIKSFIYDPMY